jgi:urea transport system ATP-binding protein
MLNVENLNVSYGQSRILWDLSFKVKQEETLTIVGRNGMGKTTLMKALIGVLKLDSGQIEVDGKSVGDSAAYGRVRNGIAYVPQGRQIFSTLTVEENILTGLESVKGKKKIDPEIYDLFPVLKEMRKRRGGNLSGGQQQQLAIARALVSEPKVLLLDEPTEGIQPSIIKDIARTLNEIKKLKKLSIVVSEQVLSFALDVADRLFVMESGKIVHTNDRDEVDEATVAKYLAV